MRIERQDPYAVLGVTPTASPAEISRAYRALLHTHHPDDRNHNVRNPEPTPTPDRSTTWRCGDAGRLMRSCMIPDAAPTTTRRCGSAALAQPGHPAAGTPPIVILGDVTRSRWPRPIWIAPVNPTPVATASITTLFAVLRGHTDAQFYRGR